MPSWNFQRVNLIKDSRPSRPLRISSLEFPEAIETVIRESTKAGAEDWWKGHVMAHDPGIIKAAAKNVLEQTKNKDGYFLWIGYSWDECVCPHWKHHTDFDELRWVQVTEGAGDNFSPTAYGGQGQKGNGPVPTKAAIARAVVSAENKGGGQTREDFQK
jgi:hypothetical protein